MKVKLGDVVQQVRGVSYKPDDLRPDLNENSITLLRANNIRDGQINLDDVLYIDRKKIKEQQILKAGDILICTSSGSKDLVGKAAYINCDMDAVFGAFCKVVRPKHEYSEYIGCYFDSPHYRRRISALSAGANINNIRNEHISELIIPLYDSKTQGRIVSVLNKLSTLISLRKQQLAKLDELVKARFVEMFGDPVENPMGLCTKRGVEFFKLSNGRTVPESKRFNKGVPAYGGNGISWYTDSALIQNDTIVVGRVGFQSGNVHFAKGPLWVTDNAMYVSSYDSSICNLSFLCMLMEMIDFTRFQDAGDLKKITQKPFMTTEYPIPPLSKQEEYIANCRAIQDEKELVMSGLERLETLKKALMQEYFE